MLLSMTSILFPRTCKKVPSLQRDFATLINLHSKIIIPETYPAIKEKTPCILFSQIYLPEKAIKKKSATVIIEDA